MSEETANEAAAKVKEALDAAAEAAALPTLREFLESHPPSTEVTVAANWTTKHTQYAHFTVVDLPDIKLYCEDEECKGKRVHRCDDELRVNEKWKSDFLDYDCSNCNRSRKRFALAHKYDKGKKGQIVVYKYGELPVFGPRVPEKLKKLVGSDRDLFFKGRRAESQGLGIGAFAYYRRVVEDRKNQLLDRLIAVTKVIDPDNKITEEFEAAKKETQFSRAIDSIKGSIPDGLLINGQNPLKLLHKALSQGIHNHTDEECLALAKGVRAVLSELIDRMDSLVKEDNELTDAVKLLKSPPASNS